MLAIERPKSGGYFHISEQRFREWCNDYPKTDVKAQIAKANDWLRRNPSREWKTLRGFEAWLARAESTATGNQKLHETVPAKDSKHYALVYDREHLDEKVERASPATVTSFIEKCKAALHMPTEVTSDPVKEPVQCKHEITYGIFDRQPWCPKCNTWIDQVRPLDDRDWLALRRISVGEW